MTNLIYSARLACPAVSQETLPPPPGLPSQNEVEHLSPPTIKGGVLPNAAILPLPAHTPPPDQTIDCFFENLPYWVVATHLSMPQSQFALGMLKWCVGWVLNQLDRVGIALKNRDGQVVRQKFTWQHRKHCEFYELDYKKIYTIRPYTYRCVVEGEAPNGQIINHGRITLNFSCHQSAIKSMQTLLGQVKQMLGEHTTHWQCFYSLVAPCQALETLKHPFDDNQIKALLDPINPQLDLSAKQQEWLIWRAMTQSCELPSALKEQHPQTSAHTDLKKLLMEMTFYAQYVQSHRFYSAYIKKTCLSLLKEIQAELLTTRERAADVFIANFDKFKQLANPLDIQYPSKKTHELCQNFHFSATLQQKVELFCENSFFHTNKYFLVKALAQEKLNILTTAKTFPPAGLSSHFNKLWREALDIPFDTILKIFLFIVCIEKNAEKSKYFSNKAKNKMKRLSIKSHCRTFHRLIQTYLQAPS